jgi:hypothetical protein
VDPSSVFAIIGLTRTGTNVSITWSAVTNKVYNVESKTSLALTDWQPVPPGITNTNGAATLSTNLPFASPDGFLRVRVIP